MSNNRPRDAAFARMENSVFPIIVRGSTWSLSRRRWTAYSTGLVELTCQGVLPLYKSGTRVGSEAAPIALGLASAVELQSDCAVSGCKADERNPGGWQLNCGEVTGEMKARATALIAGSSDSWTVATPSDPPASVYERVVLLEIQGDASNGYHLVMSPSGCFTADSWHETVGDALATAHRLFGVRPDEWS